MRRIEAETKSGRFYPQSDAFAHKYQLDFGLTYEEFLAEPDQKLADHAAYLSGEAAYHKSKR